MAGRAGRRGIDNKGYVVIVGNRFDKFEKLVSILKAKEDRCESCFEVKYGLVLCGVGRRRMREVRTSENTLTYHFLTSPNPQLPRSLKAATTHTANN